MKKGISISVFFLLMASFIDATAQNEGSIMEMRHRVQYSVGADGSIATGSSRDIYRYGLGGFIGTAIPITSVLYATASAGYQNLFYRDHNVDEEKSLNGLQLLPVKTGIKFFPVGIFYIQAEAGVAFLLNKSTTNLDKSGAFIYAPQAGVQFHIGRNNWIDAGLLYEHSSRFQSDSNDSKVSFVGLRAAYTFTFSGRP